MNQHDLCFMSITQLAPLLKGRELSPVEVTSAVLERIARMGPRINAFITLTAAAALAASRAAEREILAGHYRGPLHGVPLSLKDLFSTAGIRTTAGSKILAHNVPDHDATVVERLRAAGAVTLGKTNMHEFAYGAESTSPHFGAVRNPWDGDRIAGGSSGGSAAAVAAALGYASLGSDTGGSIRIPAACCGIVGLKPTYGLVSLHGVVPLSWSQDTAGPLTRTAADAALVLNAIAGYDPRDPASADVARPDYAANLTGDVRGLRVGVPRSYFFDRLQPEVRQLVSRTADFFSQAGVFIEEVELPHAREASLASLNITMAEATAFHEDWLRERPQDYGEDVRARIELGQKLPATEYVRAQRDRTAFRAEIADVFGRVDALLVPTLPMVAPKIGDSQVVFEDRAEIVLKALTRLTRPFNVLGIPVIAVPCGFAAGLPVSFQLAAKPLAEETILRLAHAYEIRTDWRLQHPPD